MILIAGGAGYIGSHTNKALNKLGYDTLVLDNLGRGHRELCKWGGFVKGDINDKALLHSIFNKYPIKQVMHFSALAYVGESVKDPQAYYYNNLCNTINLLNVMLEYGVKKFIFSSTCSIYGYPEQIPITEEQSQKPINPYGRSKSMVESVLADYESAYDLKYVALRYFNAAGADPDCEIGEWHVPETHLIPLAMDAAIGRNDQLEIFGVDYPTVDGTCIRDYIHVSDLADAHVAASEYLDNNTSDCFNLGIGQGFSVKEVIITVEKVTGSRINTIYGPRRPGDPPVLVSSNKKAVTVLGWKPKFTELSAIVKTAWKWHQKLHSV